MNISTVSINGREVTWRDLLRAASQDGRVCRGWRIRGDASLAPAYRRILAALLPAVKRAAEQAYVGYVSAPASVTGRVKRGLGSISIGPNAEAQSHWMAWDGLVSDIHIAIA